MSAPHQMPTEGRNPAAADLDRLSPLQFVRFALAEDAKVVPAVESQAAAIARVIEVAADRLAAGGRLVYIGAGTSGRLGVLDASECPPTFNTPPGQVIGLIAGGAPALTRAVEGAEDHPDFAVADLQSIALTQADVVVGIAASGRTPYVLGAVDYARKVGAFTAGVSCNPWSDLLKRVDVAVTPVVGPEVVSGSTRMKAGTATKLVLNTISTGVMVRLGKTYGDLMVDLRASNAKLRVRTLRILREATGLDPAAADRLLDACGRDLKTALVAGACAVPVDQARDRLAGANGRVRDAVSTPVIRAPAGPVEPLVLGFDGGGSRTVAVLATPDGDGWNELGRGVAGPSNHLAAGAGPAFAALSEAARLAFADAGIARRPVTAACLGLAGAGRREDRAAVRAWAESEQLAETVDVTTDVALLLAAGVPAGWGVALVAGTGSMAFARGPDGRTARAGGWGHLIGDEGSGYAVAVQGLRAVARAVDGRGGETALIELFQTALRLESPDGLVASIYRSEWGRPAIAALAGLVFEAAEAGDAVASRIVRGAADELAATVAAAVRQLDLGDTFPLVMSGGLLVAHPGLRERVLISLADRDLVPDTVVLVADPTDGAVRLALAALTTSASSL